MWHTICMLIHFAVSGYLDWEPAEKYPGVVITEADVRGLRAKQLTNGGWHLRVEKEAHIRDAEGKLAHYHDTNIPELTICMHLAAQAAVGSELTREDCVVHFLRQSSKHHVLRKHVQDVMIHDDGPSKDLMQQCIELHHLDEKAAAAAMERYCEDVDLRASLVAQFASRAKKEQP